MYRGADRRTDRRLMYRGADRGTDYGGVVSHGKRLDGQTLSLSAQPQSFCCPAAEQMERSASFRTRGGV